MVSSDGVVFKTRDPGKYIINMNRDPSETGGYWIVALGDIPQGETLYPWTIVSTPFRTHLFILGRNVSEFRSQYQATALAVAQEKGFDKWWNEPLETYQGSDCTYSMITGDQIIDEEEDLE